MKVGLPLMRNVLRPLANSGYGWTTATSAADAGIQTMITSKEEREDIMKIVK